MKTEHFKPIQSILYLLTTGVMAFEIFSYLSFATKGLEIVDLQIFLEAWPSVILSIAAILLLISSMLALAEPERAAKLALIASSLGCFYWVTATCMLFFLTSIAFLFTIQGWLILLPLGLLLVTSIWISVRILNRARTMQRK